MENESDIQTKVTGAVAPPGMLLKLTNNIKPGDKLYSNLEFEPGINIINSKVLGNIINGFTLDTFEQERARELNEKL